MERSNSLAELAAALAAAQGEIAGAPKSSENPFFKSRYADLASVWDACRGPLSKNGLSIVQLPTTDGFTVKVRTVLLHASGEFIEETLTMAAADERPQSIGSAITYGRRYGLMAVVGIAPEDDDGEAAQGRLTGQQVQAGVRQTQQEFRGAIPVRTMPPSQRPKPKAPEPTEPVNVDEIF